MTLYEQIERKCLKVRDLRNYLIWRGVKVDKSTLHHWITEQRKIPKHRRGVLDMIEQWVENPINPKFEETKN